MSYMLQLATSYTHDVITQSALFAIQRFTSLQSTLMLSTYSLEFDTYRPQSAHLPTNIHYAVSGTFSIAIVSHTWFHMLELGTVPCKSSNSFYNNTVFIQT